MSAEMIEKIRAARAVRIEFKGMVFLARRPSVEKYNSYITAGTLDSKLCIDCVTGWENVRECDLLPGASQAAVAWDPVLFAESIVDNPKLMGKISLDITNAVLEALRASQEQEKNSQAGSNSAA